MNHQATMNTRSLSTSAHGAGARHQAIGFLLGAGFTLGLFAGIARYETNSDETPLPPTDDLHVARLPMEPPPLPVKPLQAGTSAPAVAGFEAAPTESPVKIAVGLPEMAAILPKELSKAPRANPQLGLALSDFRPTMNLAYDTEHIYQKSEVDRTPQILERPNPRVSSRVRDNARVLHVTLVAVIDADGSIGQIRLTKSSGNPEFDQLMMESIKGWIFSPAIKAGKKVRCLIEQGITVQWENGSSFHV